MSKLIFRRFKYNKNHWPIKMQNSENRFIIRNMNYKRYNFVVRLNPTDSRGYRTIVSYLGKNNDQIEGTLNRKYAHEENCALQTIASKIGSCFESFDLVTQIEVAGNNCHEFINNITYIWTENEPGILHSHIICSGDQKNNYIGDVILKGDEHGMLFNMCENKIKWSENESEQVVKTINIIYEKKLK